MPIQSAKLFQSAKLLGANLKSIVFFGNRDCAIPMDQKRGRNALTARGGLLQGLANCAGSVSITVVEKKKERGYAGCVGLGHLGKLEAAVSIVLLKRKQAEKYVLMRKEYSFPNSN